MSLVEVFATLLHSFAFVVLYFITGFGPGFILGMILANAIFGRGRPAYIDSHQEAIKRAAQHNAQWAPSNERWQQ
ncbi:MAG: hypothetical protein WEA04_03700 [Candidatus Andersenbacteria bacterium]